jgi:hypothetical protein
MISNVNISAMQVVCRASVGLTPAAGKPAGRDVQQSARLPFSEARVMRVRC